jgi:hypothetical protein
MTRRIGVHGRRDRSNAQQGFGPAEIVVSVGVCEQAARGEVWLGGRESLPLVSENPNKDERFQQNSHGVSKLASSDSFVSSRLFASVFSFCQCNDT